MTKILVTTDLSKNSRSGMRFAIQLASQSPSALVFYHAVELIRPTKWNDGQFEQFANGEIASARKRLDRLVKSVYRQIGKKVSRYVGIVEAAAEADAAITKYAKEHNFDFICMSTRGAGTFRRLIGTSTSAVLQRSQTPVFVIPKNYRRERIKHVLYSSDLNSLDKELKIVKSFSSSVKAKISVLHYDYLQQVREVNEKLEGIARRYRTNGVAFHFQKFQIENSLASHLKTAIVKYKPSVVVLFTKQNRDLFDRLFSSSKSATASFESTKPLLVFAKKE